MHIGIDISQLAYPHTGVAVYTQQLVSNLLKSDQENSYVLFGSSLRQKHRLEKFYFDYSNNRSNCSKRFYSLPNSFLTFLWNQWHKMSIDKLIGQVDIFHSSDWLEPPCRAKKITTIHDLLIYKYPKFVQPSIVANQRRKLGWVKKESHAIIADSESTKNDICEILKIPEDKIHVVYLGVSSDFSQKSSQHIKKIRDKYGLASEYILGMGSEPRKNVARVIKAYQKLPQKKDVQLAVIGQLSRPVDVSDLPALYSGATCFVYPSLYEGFGLPVLEAMACCCPVITSNRGSLREVVGQAAIIVDPENIANIAEAMEYVIDSSLADRQEMIKKGMAWAKNFSWEKTARETLRVYHKLF